MKYPPSFLKLAGIPLLPRINPVHDPPPQKKTGRHEMSMEKTGATTRGGSRISGKGVHMCKGVGSLLY